MTETMTSLSLSFIAKVPPILSFLPPTSVFQPTDREGRTDLIWRNWTGGGGREKERKKKKEFFLHLFVPPFSPSLFLLR